MSDDAPRILVDDTAALARNADRSAAGAIWKLDPTQRDLDSNLIALPPGGGIDAHEGPDLDVLVHVVAGSGQLHSDGQVLDLRPGTLLWLPRRAPRQFTAGPEGLSYLTVHQRRRVGGLQIERR